MPSDIDAATESAALSAAAAGLRRGDPLFVLRSTQTLTSPAAAALRGAALAQLEEFEDALACLSFASTSALAQGKRQLWACAELATAEIELSTRELSCAETRLSRCAAELEEDQDNRCFAAVLRARLELLRGNPQAALGHLAVSEAGDHLLVQALTLLARAEAALALGRADDCVTALAAAKSCAQQARHGYLLAEIEVGEARLRLPAARLSDSAGERVISVLDLARLRAERTDGVILDATTQRLLAPSTKPGPHVVVRLAKRPSLFRLLASLAEPGGPHEPDQLLLALGVRRANESQRARLRVEMGRLRGLLPPPLRIVMGAGGYRLVGSEVTQLKPLGVCPFPELMAMLSDGCEWRCEELASALGHNRRWVQRGLSKLHEEGLIRRLGSARQTRWAVPGPLQPTLLGQLALLFSQGVMKLDRA